MGGSVSGGDSSGIGGDNKQAASSSSGLAAETTATPLPPSLSTRRPVLRIPKAGWIRAAPGVCLMGKGDSVSQQRHHDDDNGKEADDSL